MLKGWIYQLTLLSRVNHALFKNREEIGKQQRDCLWQQNNLSFDLASCTLVYVLIERVSDKKEMQPGFPNS